MWLKENIGEMLRSDVTPLTPEEMDWMGLGENLSPADIAEFKALISLRQERNRQLLEEVAPLLAQRRTRQVFRRRASDAISDLNDEERKLIDSFGSAATACKEMIAGDRCGR